ncbi:MAG: XdhC family protein [Deltaproteobacteria bacterium]|nr:XdhC family protein [Deltaproteobacteria bacterium]
MSTSDPAFFRRLAELAAAGEPCATAQIVRVNGSIPNALGARLLAGPDGELIAGTVGGGAIEHQTLAAVRDALAEGKSRLFTAKLVEHEAGGIGMMCGGQVDVFIDVLTPEPRLVLCGAGHINLALARLARGLGYRVVVIDDRPEWCNVAHYPDAELHVARPEERLANLALDAASFVVVGTRDRDTEVIVAAAATPARYIGVVASRRKAIRIVKHLSERADVDVAALLPRLHAPIGLALGGRTPEAVALSILAEVQLVRHAQPGGPMRVAPDELARFADRATRS